MHIPVEAAAEMIAHAARAHFAQCVQRHFQCLFACVVTGA